MGDKLDHGPYSRAELNCLLSSASIPPSDGDLKRITDVRETTRSARIRARLPMRASVIPLAKYSCVGSPERLASGSTASALIDAGSVAAFGVARQKRSRAPATSTHNPLKTSQRDGDGRAAVALAVLAWRENDGFGAPRIAFAGGTAIGQWRPVLPAVAMSAQGLAFTDMFVLAANDQFRPQPPRALDSATYTRDFNAVKTLGRNTGSSRTAEQTALAPFWEGKRQRPLESGCKSARACLDLPDQPAARGTEHRDGRYGVTIWSAKRFYGEASTEVTWRPVTATVRLRGWVGQCACGGTRTLAGSHALEWLDRNGDHIPVQHAAC